MEGLKVNFLNGDIYIEPEAKVTDFDATVQNALANIGTRQGTDRIYPSKGTNILKSAVEGKIAGLNVANHEAQLAAINTLFFSREYETSTNLSVKLGKVFMDTLSYDGAKLRINSAFTNFSETITKGTVTLL
ncbi:MAG: hypothetical protein ACK5DE_02250 [Bacteroidota bacterium]|jgi:hypothetical protein